MKVCFPVNSWLRFWCLEQVRIYIVRAYVDPMEWFELDCVQPGGVFVLMFWIPVFSSKLFKFEIPQLKKFGF